MILAVGVAAYAIAGSQQPAPNADETVVVEAQRTLPSISLMNDHMHNRGEFMIGIRCEHFDWSGAKHHRTPSGVHSRQRRHSRCRRKASEIRSLICAAALPRRASDLF